MTETVHAYFKGGPFNGRMICLPKDKLEVNLEILANDTAYYRIIDGPVLKTFLAGGSCDNLAVTFEFVRLVEPHQEFADIS